jgi:hypothetical protein
VLINKGRLWRCLLCRAMDEDAIGVRVWEGDVFQQSTWRCAERGDGTGMEGEG